VIRWITNNLGTAPYGSVTESADLSTIDVRDLVDKHGNTTEIVLQKINNTISKLAEGKKVVICCDYGISRSNAVAAGVLSKFENISFKEAVEKVVVNTGEKEIKVDMLNIVRQSLDGYIHTNKDQNNRRILLTGGSGFIGQHLCNNLAAVTDIYSPSSKEIDLITDTVALDLYISEHNIDSIVHLANPRIYTSNQGFGKTLIIMRNILDVCRNHELKLYYLSSWEVFSGYRDQMTIADESLTPKATGPYGESKLLAEVLLQQFISNYGLSSCLIRSGTVYGSGSTKPRYIYNFLDKAQKGKDIYTHRYLNGLPEMDLVHQKDLVSALNLLITNNAEGIYHIGGNGLHTSKDIALMVIELVSSTSKLYHLEVQDHFANIQMDISRINREFGWKPDVEFYQGLKSLISN
jgi:nucleoside-diphosphate-sugar epimerase